MSSLVAELAERDLVRDGSAERGSVGRPGTTVELSGRGVCGVGAEINVHHVAALAVEGWFDADYTPTHLIYGVLVKVAAAWGAATLVLALAVQARTVAVRRRR